MRAPAYIRETAVDLKQLYFDHENTLIRADGAATPETAGRLGVREVRLGAAAACAWMANARRVAA